jgi:hypothetical protein
MGSIAETLLMGIGKQRTSLEARLAGRAVEVLVLEVARVASGGPVVRVALAELAVRVASAEPVVLVELAELAVRVASEAPVVLAGLAELAVRVASEAPAELVAQEVPEALAELVVRVEALELEIVQVVAQETKHLAAQAAVVLRTKSVTAAHRRGLVLVLAAED